MDAMGHSWMRHHVIKQSGDDPASSLEEHGLALLEGVGDQDSLLRLARSIATIVPHRDSDSSGLTTISDNGNHVRTGFAGFTACALNPHTDRSGIANPPHLLMMACGQPAASGGECFVVDGKAVYDDLTESHPQAIKALSTPRSVLFGGAAGHLGSIFTQVGDRIAIRLRLDNLAQFSPEVTRWLPTLRATIDRHTHVFRLDRGHGYVLDNYRWLHGRREFTGQRVMYRVTANPLPHSAVTPGFRPAGSPARHAAVSQVGVR